MRMDSGNSLHEQHGRSDRDVATIVPPEANLCILCASTIQWRKTWPEWPGAMAQRETPNDLPPEELSAQMTIHQPEVSLSDGEVTVAARIECETSDTGLPEVLWFRVPEQFQSFVTDRADGFATSLLVCAMNIGEPVTVRGTMSPRLLYGFNELQAAMELREPKDHRRVEIRCDKLEAESANSVQPGVVTTFSGGADGFYTLWKHLPSSEPLTDFQVTHALFIHGLDIPPSDTATCRAIIERYSALAKRLQVEFVTAVTNVRSFRRLPRGIDFLTGYSLGQAPAGAVQVLGRGFRRYLSPSNYNYTQRGTGSSHHSTDYLYSTETLEVLYHGGGLLRFGKLAALSEWEETYSNLRVCRGRYHGFRNCGKCPKCVSTMLQLELLGRLDRYTTFARPLTRWNLWFMALDTDDLPRHRWRILRQAISAGRYDRVIDLLLVYLANVTPMIYLRRRYRGVRRYVRRIMGLSLKPVGTAGTGGDA
jgi:hypothetical protein